VLPEIEVLLDKYSKQDAILRVEEFNIDFTVGGQNYLNDILSLTRHHINKRLEVIGSENIVEGFRKDDVREITRTDAIGETFLFFLKNGYLPWFGNESYLDDIASSDQWKTKLKDVHFLTKLTDILSSQEASIDRFVLQFSPEMIFSFLRKVNHKAKIFSKNILDFEKKLDAGHGKAYLKLLLQISVYNDKHRLSQTPELVNLFVQPNLGKDLKKLIGKLKPDFEFSETDTHDNSFDEQGSEESFLESGKNEIAVKCAGLILLHPFLKHFFRNIGVISPEDKIYKDKLALAVQGLHYLASGDEDFFEANLIFEKFLCGLPLKLPLQRESLLTVSVKKEAATMLNEVIKNWPALKNTSAEGLQQMFLQRRGKLIKTEQGFKLMVERAAQDVLLDKITWNISLVKLPWVKELLFVEW
jgi:hypothetical protein